MKAWIRDREGDDWKFPTRKAEYRQAAQMIVALDKPDGEVIDSIAPTKEDPAQLIPSDRTDGYEQVVWHEQTHLVQSIDLDFEREVRA